MAYFQPYIDETGVRAPSYADRMEDLTAAYRGIFGPDADLTPSSPDYRLLSVFARALDDMTALAVAGFAARDPALASGAALDLLLPLHGIAREGPTGSTVILRLTGDPGAGLPDGVEALDAADRAWRLPSGIVLDAQGSADVTAVCEEPGAVAAPEGTVCRLAAPVTGLTAVTNPLPAVPGREGETDAEVRARFARAAAAPSLTVADAIAAALADVPGVRDSRLFVNDTDTADARGIPPHSVCAVAAGGLNADIARALFLKKPPGVGTGGSTAVTVTDDAGNAHTVRFQRALETVCGVEITLTALDGFDADRTVPRIKAALVDFGGTLTVGQPLAVSMLYGLCYAADPATRPTFSVSGLRVSAGGVWHTGVITPEWRERLLFDAGYITVTVS